MTTPDTEKGLARFILEQVKDGRLEKDHAIAYLQLLKEKRPSQDPRVAVVGMAARLAGAENPDQLWQGLAQGVGWIGPLPARRHDDAKRALARFGIDQMDAFRCGYLDQIDGFDAEYFKIAPSAALQMDPYQRVLLEVMTESIHNAGYGKSSLAGTRTGVFVGTDHTHKLLMSYLSLVQSRQPPDFIAMTGSWTGILASRLSYLLNLRGPSLVIDTACSSGLVALDAATSALHRNDCQVAIVAGINLYLAPHRMGIASDIESQQARVRTFDRKANGTVWGEGVCALMLKPLAHAVRDRDHVYGVIRASAVNNDGASNGIAAPNAEAQTDVLKQAWARAGIDPGELSYVEAHGTGTALGDHIEIKALTEAFAPFTEKRQFCGVGSIKTNIGHTVGAAGLASVLKVLLSLERGLLPPSLNFEEPNPLIDFCESPLYVVDRLQPWARNAKPRLAGVSSFSLNGTNCHVVIEEAPAVVRTQSAAAPWLMALSARNRDLLLATVNQYERYLAGSSRHMDDVSFTAAVGRDHQPVRAAIVAASPSEAIEALRLLRARLAGQPTPASEWPTNIFCGTSSATGQRAGRLPGEGALAAWLEEARTNGESLRREALSRLGEAYVAGANLDWQQLFAGEDVRRVALPGVSMKRQRFWVELPDAGPRTASPSEQAPATAARKATVVNLHAADGQNVTDTERMVGGVWAEILGFAEMDVCANLYDLGGDSLSAARIANGLGRAGVEVSISEVLRHQSVRALSSQVDLQREPKAASGTIVPVASAPAYAMSSAQRRMYFLAAFAPEGIAYNVSSCVHVAASCDPEAVRRALDVISHRHEILRTSFDLQEGAEAEPTQVVHAAARVPMAYRKLPAGAAESEVITLFREFVRPFDLAVAPLFRVGILDAGARGWYLMTDAHHTVADGSSMGIFVQELLSVLENRPLPELALQYRDYAAWERAQIQSGRVSEALQYWQQLFSEPPPRLELPLDEKRPHVQCFSGARVFFELEVELTSRLASLAREARTTPFVVLVSAFSLLLSKYSGQDELVIGTPVHGRTRREVEGLIGMFVNTLALRLSPEGTLSFCAYLQRVKDRVLEAFAHESCPFDLVIERLNLPRDAGRSPLFDVTFVLQNEDMGLAHESVRPVEAPGGQSRFDLTLIARPDSGGTRCELEYCTALFNPETAARMARHFVQVCEALVAEPERELRHVSLASAGEIAQILEVFNDTRRPYPDTACIPALFEAQAREHADKVAVKEAYPVAGRTEARSLSYRELDQQATGIARRLQSAGAKPGSIVPVFVDKSADAIAAFLGILKAGCAYLPVDDEVPGQRKRFLLTDSRASHAVVHRPCPPALTHMLDQCGVVPVFSDGDLTPDTGNDPPWKGSGEDRAYVLYTSGSTGIPKGTVVQHKSVVRLVRAQSYADFSPTLRILQTGALDFDASTLEIWGPLLSGGTVCLLAKPDLLEIDRLKRAIQENAINTMWMSSPLFNQLLESDGSLFDSLRHVLVGGDVVSPSHVRRLRARVPRIRVTNGYGPTENTTFSTTFDLPVGEEVPDPIPIGRPIANSICYVLDGQGRVLPVGVPGELWVGGDGVALGYLNRDDLTRAAFIPDPFRSGGRIYRTGDRARWLTDGTLHFLGRLDQQLKLRGFRIEPGEIEKQLLEHGLVREACVVAACGEAGDKALHAYIAASAPTSPDELVTFLRQRLPAHMIPSTVVILDRLPLNKNGKIDRSLLPAPAPSSLLSAAKGLAAETPAERMMGEIVAEVLGLGAVSMDADFFSLGGDSIKAIQLCARARAHGMQLAVRDVFSCPRIRELALLLKAAKAPGRQHPGQGPAPLAPIQAWFFKQGFRDQHHFTQGVRIEGKAGVFDGTRLRRAWEQLIVRHASLRTTYGKEGGAWMPVTADVGDSAARWYTFEEAALATQDSGEVERRVREAQRRLSVENGPMSTLGLYHLGKSDVLVVAIHHLAVDAVSWQILMEDLLILYGQGEDAELAVGSDTFAGWTRSVQALAESNEIGREVEYWHKLASRAQTIPRLATNAEPVPCSQLGTVRLSYSAAQVQEASRAAERACAATTEEILLCALGGALAEWQGTQAALIQVESHGRDALQDALDDGPDVSRTVGWFTSAFPLVLPAGPNPLLSLQAAKEARRTVPHSGLGFGILAGATEKPDARVREAVALLRPDICFNFLGALLPQRDEALGFEVTRLPFELTRSPEQHAPFALDVEAGLDGGGLEVVLRYARPTISAERAAALAGAFDRQFHALIAESRATRTTTRTASDFGAKDLGADDLVDILDELAVTR